MGGGAIVGVVLAVLAVLVLALSLAVAWRRRSEERAGSDKDEDEHPRDERAVANPLYDGAANASNEKGGGYLAVESAN